MVIVSLVWGSRGRLEQFAMLFMAQISVIGALRYEYWVKMISNVWWKNTDWLYLH